jgi:hypothetical protein
MKLPRLFLRKRTARFAQLAARDDVRVIGPLAEALRSWDGESQRIAEDALVRLLPRLRAEHEPMIGPDARKSLYRALRGKNESLSLAIIKALRYIGDAEALITVSRMVYDKSRAGIESRVQNAAIALLPELQERVEEQNAVTTLLRASTPYRPAGEYLRASCPPGIPLSTSRPAEMSATDSDVDETLYMVLLGRRMMVHRMAWH